MTPSSRGELRVPGSRLPSIAQAGHLALDPEGFFARQLARRGDPFVVRLPSIGEVIVSGTPDGARELFSAPPDTFAPLPVNPVEPLLGQHSLLILAGDRHKRERKLMSPPFHGERMRAYGTIMCARAAHEAAGWKTGDTIVLQEAMRRITLDVILRAVLGLEGDSKLDVFRRAISAMLDSYVPPLLVLPSLRRPLGGLSHWSKFERARDRVRALFAGEIEERRRSLEGRTDILTLLMQARYDDGDALTTDELIDEARTLIVGGHDTTTTALVWAFFYLHRERDTLARLLEELSPLGADPSPEALAELPYLGAVCNEALRLHPVVPIVPRMAVRPLEFRGCRIAVGQYVAVAVSLLHRHPGLWERPDNFEPERFLTRKYSPFEFAPFGGGARRCIGAAFGAYQMRMVLGTVLARATLRLVGRRQPRRILAAITMGPAGAIRAHVSGSVAGS